MPSAASRRTPKLMGAAGSVACGNNRIIATACCGAPRPKWSTQQNARAISLRWIADSFICARDLGSYARANVPRKLALERILVGEIVVKGAFGHVRPHRDFIHGQRSHASR